MCVGNFVNMGAGHFKTSVLLLYLSAILDDLLADGALPQALVAVQLEVGLQVESLDVSTVLAPRGQRYPLVGQGTP